MKKAMMLVLVTGLFAMPAGGCGSNAPVEQQGSTTSHLDDDPNIVDGNYVETYADEATASDRANDMRSVGLTVDQEGTLLRVRPTEGAGVMDMVDSASADYLAAKWGAGGGVQYASKSLNLQSATIRPQGLSLQPVGLPVEVSIGGSVHVTGSVTATPQFHPRAESCGRGCIKLSGHAGLDIDANVTAAAEGSITLGREAAELGEEVLVGTTIIVIPTPIPIPVTVSIYVSAAIACEGEIEGKVSVGATAKGSVGVDFWSTIDRQNGLGAGASAQMTLDGNLSGSASIDKVTFACGVPEIQVIARIYELGGPFVSFGPKIALSSGASGPMHVKQTFDTAVGVEAKRLGFESIKQSGPSFDLSEGDL